MQTITQHPGWQTMQAPAMKLGAAAALSATVALGTQSLKQFHWMGSDRVALASTQALGGLAALSLVTNGLAAAADFHDGHVAKGTVRALAAAASGAAATSAFVGRMPAAGAVSLVVSCALSVVAQTLR